MIKYLTRISRMYADLMQSTRGERRESVTVMLRKIFQS